MLLVVLVDKSQVEIPYVARHSLEPHNLNVINAEDKEMRLSYIYKARFCWLQQNIRSKSCPEKS